MRQGTRQEEKQRFKTKEHKIFEMQTEHIQGCGESRRHRREDGEEESVKVSTEDSNCEI